MGTGLEEGLKLAWEEGRKMRLAMSRQHVVALIENRLPGSHHAAWVNAIDDPDLLDSIFQAFLAPSILRNARRIRRKSAKAR